MQGVEDAVRRLQGLAFSAKASRTSSKASFFEHELARRIDRPVMSFAGTTKAFGQLDEALVQR